MSGVIDPSSMSVEDIKHLKMQFDREDCEASLHYFLRRAWKYISAAPFVDGWAMQAVCEHLEAVVDGDIRRLIINIPPRCAKPVDQNALVNTLARGLIPLGEVTTSDHVLTHKGRFRRVIAVHPQGVLPVLKLTTRSNREILAAHDHPFLTPDGWKNLGGIIHQDVVGLIPQREPSGTQTISNEEARLLGYLVGDGCVSGTPNITVADDIESEDIRKVIIACGFEPTEQTYHLTKSGGTLRRISIKAGVGFEHKRKPGYMGPVKRFLLKHGILNGSSYTKMIPPDVMRGNDDVICNFIGAYWACDGYVTTRGVKRDGTEREDVIIGCDSVNKNFMLQLQALLLRIGVNSRIRKKIANIKTAKQGDAYTSYSLSVTNQDDCWRFASKIEIIHSKGEKLKHAKRRRFDFDHAIVGDVVDSIVPFGGAECVCLTVDEDESFVANGFAVHNSSMCSVALPAWVWAQSQTTHTSGPSVKFLTASYAQQLALRDSVATRRLIKSPWYQARWGERFVLTGDQNTKSRYDNDKHGSRLAASVDSAATGEGGDIIIVDDPNAAQEAFSEATIEATTDWWDQTMSTRHNNQKLGAFIIIQQRLAEDDLTGHILEKNSGEWTHLMLPMRFEPDRRTYNKLGPKTWTDPRKNDGDLLWPERFGDAEVKSLEKALGTFGAAGQLQQRPRAVGAEIIPMEYWQPWLDDIYPAFDYVLASLDTAYTEKQENDFSALTVWGIFSAGSRTARASNTVNRGGKMRVSNRAYEDGAPRAMLMWAWEAKLQFHELVTKVNDSCKRMKVDKIIIENKAAGISVAQELRRLIVNETDYAVQLIDPGSTSKLARLYSVQHIFEEGIVHAPEYGWSDKVINQVATFPKGKHDDLVDTVSMAVRHLRDLGMLQRAKERDVATLGAMTHHGAAPPPLY